MKDNKKYTGINKKYTGILELTPCWNAGMLE